MNLPNEKKVKKRRKKPTAKEVFDKRVSKSLTGKNSNETIDIFSNLSFSYFYLLSKKYKLKERQISSFIGLKDEFFVKTLVDQIIGELGLENKIYCRKITANENAGLKSRKISFKKKDKILTVGGDCVIFRSSDDKPVMIIECKEYIDIIRMKELIGESRIIKDEIAGSERLLGEIKFCVFSEVLELTEAWANLLKNSDLKYKIDEIFIIRDGKRKDKDNKPIKNNLLGFKKYISKFLMSIK